MLTNKRYRSTTTKTTLPLSKYNTKQVITNIKQEPNYYDNNLKDNPKETVIQQAATQSNSNLEIQLL